MSNNKNTSDRAAVELWREEGSCFIPQPRTQSLISKLDSNVYCLKYNDRIGIYLEKMFDKFVFNFKLYGIENNFINHVIKTFNINSKNNLGILLNGIKGTGKTITAQQICNKLNLPVIVVQGNYGGLVEFIASLSQDVIFFFDEFEKIFGDSGNASQESAVSGSTSLLSVMDGVSSTNTQCRKVFVLTTNTMDIDLNFIQRPGRIRYIKSFGNLNINVINEIIEDKLVYKEFTKDLISIISRLELITIDIVNSLIDETNIHKISPMNFIDFFNINVIDIKYDVVMERIDDKNEKYISTVVNKTYIYPDIFCSEEHERLIRDKCKLLYSSYDFMKNESINNHYCFGIIIGIELINSNMCKVKLIKDIYNNIPYEYIIHKQHYRNYFGSKLNVINEI